MILYPDRKNGLLHFMTEERVSFSGRRGWLRLSAFAGMFLSVCMMQGCAHTDETVQLYPRVIALQEMFPAGAIDTVEKADEVQDAVKYERKMLDYQFGLDMNACTKKFLVTNCYDETNLRLRTNRAALRMMSVEADRFKRSEKVRVRDQAMVDAEQEWLSKETEREAARQRYKEKEDRYIQENATAKPGKATAKHPASLRQNENQPSYVDMMAPDEASPPKVKGDAYTVSQPSQLKAPDTVLTPEERAQNVHDYEEKQQESERKQENVQRKTADTQAKRDKRAANAQKDEALRQKQKQKVAED